MELLCSRSIDMNGGGLGDSDDGTGADNGSILRQKYERAAKDLEYAKKRLAQQHEDDMEQLMALKKQLEKKVNWRTSQCQIPCQMETVHGQPITDFKKSSILDIF